MIDFHAHILPGIDDGSKSVEESLQLLRMLASWPRRTFMPGRILRRHSAKDAGARGRSCVRT